MTDITTRSFVSVIVPVYNNVEGVDNILRALLAQTYPQDCYEIIIADNGSKDGTRELVELAVGTHSGRVSLAVEDRVRSSYAARNKGISVAAGEILAFTDSDCLPVNVWLEAGVTALQVNHAACGGGRVEFTYKSSKPNIYEYLDSTSKLDQQRYVEKSGFAATANFFARKELFTRYGLFRSDLVSGGDYEFGRRVVSAGESIVYVHDAVVRHPARCTFKEVFTKTRRVAKGQKQLAGMGFLIVNRWAVLRQVLPAKSWPKDPTYGKTLTLSDKFKLIMVQSVLRWTNLAVRIR